MFVFVVIYMLLWLETDQNFSNLQWTVACTFQFLTEQTQDEELTKQKIHSVPDWPSAHIPYGHFCMHFYHKLMRQRNPN